MKIKKTKKNNLVKSTNESDYKLAVIGKSQSQDWSILWKTFILVLILSVTAGALVYINITEEIGADIKNGSSDNGTFDKEKADEIIYDYQMRKINFEEISKD